MVSLIKYGALSGGEKYNTNILKIDGLSTDTKPITTFIEYGVDGREIGRTNIENGSTFTEIDTGKLFMYDAENATWYEIVTSGGGGGGGTDNYNLLSNKPKVNGVELKGDKSFVDLGILFGSSLVAEIDSSTYVVTLTLKDQEGNVLGEPQSLDLPLESVVVGGSYNSQTKKVVLTLQNGNTIEFSVADLVSGLQAELSASNKLNPAYINYDSTHRAVSDTEKSTWNGKQNALSAAQLAAANSGIDSAKVEQIETNKNNILWNTNNGVKNIINNTAAASTENAGIVWSKNADGSMTGNGTCTGTSGVRVVGTQGVHTYAAAVSIPRGTYIVAPTGKNRPNEQFIMYLWTNSGVTGQSITINTSAYEFTVDNDTTKFDFSVSFTGTNVQISNDTLYPMICLKSLYNADPTYQPYAPTNRELYEMILALQSGS